MPVTIWITKFNPSIDPQFHMYEIEEGVGRLIKADEPIFWTGCFSKIIFIYLDDFIALTFLSIVIDSIYTIITTRLNTITKFLNDDLYIVSNVNFVFLLIEILCPTKIDSMIVIIIRVFILIFFSFSFGASETIYIKITIIPLAYTITSRSGGQGLAFTAYIELAVISDSITIKIAILIGFFIFSIMMDTTTKILLMQNLV